MKIIGYLSILIGNIFLILVTIIPTLTLISYPEAEPPYRFYGYSYFGIYAACVSVWLLVPDVRKLPYTQVVFIGVGASMATATLVITGVQQGAQSAAESLTLPFVLFFTPTPYIILMIIGFIFHGLKR